MGIVNRNYQTVAFQFITLIFVLLNIAGSPVASVAPLFVAGQRMDS